MKSSKFHLITLLICTCSFVYADPQSDLTGKLKEAFSNRDVDSIVALYHMNNPNKKELFYVKTPWEYAFKDVAKGYSLKSVEYTSKVPSDTQKTATIDGTTYSLSLVPIGQTKGTFTMGSGKQAIESLVGVEPNGSLSLVYMKQMPNTAQQDAAANP